MPVRRDTPWTGRRLRTAAAVGTALLLGAALSGCGSGSGGSVSSAASAVQSAASGVVSQGAAALASASAAASSALARVKDGLDAKNHVKLGGTTTDPDGRTSVEVSVTNTDSSTRDFVITVNFRDSGGNTLDTSVLTIKGVAAGGSGKGTAHSNRTLQGTVTAGVGAALRY